MQTVISCQKYFLHIIYIHKILMIEIIHEKHECLAADHNVNRRSDQILIDRVEIMILSMKDCSLHTMSGTEKFSREA